MPRRSEALAVGGDVGGAAAVAVGRLSSFDVEIQELHLEKKKKKHFYKQFYSKRTEM